MGGRASAASKNKWNAKMQLMRYMNVYDTKIGLAIGRKLTVDLPANIEFIPLTELTAFK